MSWFDTNLLGISKFFLEGAAFQRRPALNFKGAGVVVADNETLDAIDVTISGSGGFSEDVVSEVIDINTGTPLRAVFQDDPGLAVGEQVTIGVRVDVWRAATPDVSGTADAVVRVRRTASAIEIIGTPEASLDLSALDPQWTISFSIESDLLTVGCAATVASRMVVRLYKAEPLAKS